MPVLNRVFVQRAFIIWWWGSFLVVLPVATASGTHPIVLGWVIGVILVSPFVAQRISDTASKE